MFLKKSIVYFINNLMKFKEAKHMRKKLFN